MWDASEVWAKGRLEAYNLGSPASNYLGLTDTLSYKRNIKVLEEAGSAEGMCVLQL
jgi:hypothetical protein